MSGIKWVFKPESFDYREASAPVVSHGVVYCVIGQSVYACDREGRKLWRYHTAGLTAFMGLAGEITPLGDPALGPCGVYVGAGYYFRCVRSDNGKQRWWRRLGDYVLGPILAGSQRVYVSCSDGYVYALRAYDGRDVWKFLVGGDSEHISVDEVQGVLCCESGNCRLWGIDSDRGDMLWKATGANAQISDQVVYCIRDESLVALDLYEGTEAWRMSGYSYLGPVDSGVAYVVSQHGEIAAIDLRDRRVQWLAETGKAESTPCVVSDGVLYCKSDGRLHGLACQDEFGLYGYDIATGEAVWEWRMDAHERWPPFTGPAVENGVVYYGKHNAVYAVYGASRSSFGDEVEELDEDE